MTYSRTSKNTNANKQPDIYKIISFCGCVDEVSVLASNSVSLCISFQCLCGNIVVLSSKVKMSQEEEEYIVSDYRNQIPDGAAFHPRKTDNLSVMYGC